MNVYQSHYRVLSLSIIYQRRHPAAKPGRKLMKPVMMPPLATSRMQGKSRPGNEKSVPNLLKTGPGRRFSAVKRRVEHIDSASVAFAKATGNTVAAPIEPANYDGESLTARVNMTKTWGRVIRQRERTYQKHEELPEEVEQAMLKLEANISQHHSSVLSEFRIMDKDGSGSLTIEANNPYADHSFSSRD